jgi:AcrR family transcriptional regulator
MKRKYELKKRAERQAETRQRIVEAAVALHRERGVAHTTITEIAERAGVQRLTVYNHFPDDAALLDGCSKHWWGLHPLPDVGAWAGVDGLEQRLRAALRDLYAYYAETEDMNESFLRDASLVPAVGALLERTWHPYLREARDVVARASARRGRRTLLAAIALALDFHTWRTLVRDGGLAVDEAVDVVVGAVRAADATRGVARG